MEKTFEGWRKQREQWDMADQDEDTKQMKIKEAQANPNKRKRDPMEEFIDDMQNQLAIDPGLEVPLTVGGVFNKGVTLTVSPYPGQPYVIKKLVEDEELAKREFETMTKLYERLPPETAKYFSKPLGLKGDAIYMEKAPGTEMSKLFSADKTITPEEYREYVKKYVNALVEANEITHFAHRDLHGNNVLVNIENDLMGNRVYVPTIIDFGLAKFDQADDNIRWGYMNGNWPINQKLQQQIPPGVYDKSYAEIQINAALGKGPIDRRRLNNPLFQLSEDEFKKKEKIHNQQIVEARDFYLSKTKEHLQKLSKHYENLMLEQLAKEPEIRYISKNKEAVDPELFITKLSNLDQQHLNNQREKEKIREEIKTQKPIYYEKKEKFMSDGLNDTYRREFIKAQKKFEKLNKKEQDLYARNKIIKRLMQRERDFPPDITVGRAIRLIEQQNKELLAKDEETTEHYKRIKFYLGNKK